MCTVTIYGCDYGRGMDWILDLLTLLRVITASPLISTFYKSLLQTLNLLQSAVSWTSRSLATASNSGDFSVSRAQVACRARLNCQSSTNNWQLPTSNSGTRLTLLITFRQEPHRKQLFHYYSPTVPRPLHVYTLPREPVYRAVAWR
jgi:hypothetical protein